MDVKDRIKRYAEERRHEVEREQRAFQAKIEHDKKMFGVVKEKFDDVSTDDLKAYKSHMKETVEYSIVPVIWLFVMLLALAFHTLIAISRDQSIFLPTIPGIVFVVGTTLAIVFSYKIDHDLSLIGYELKRRECEEDESDDRPAEA